MIARAAWVPRVARLGGALHRRLYRLSGGKVGGSLWGLPVVLLTTTGRRSGRPRTTPLCALPAGNDLVVVGSFGGLDTPPAWWLNLQALPSATLQVGREQWAVTSRDAAGAERERLWGELTRRAPGYARYQSLTERQIPLVVLARRPT